MAVECHVRVHQMGNPLAEERFSSPYPLYKRIRVDGPVVSSRAFRQWFVFGYDEVHEVLRSPDSATSPVADLTLSPVNIAGSRHRLGPTRRGSDSGIHGPMTSTQ